MYTLYPNCLLRLSAPPIAQHPTRTSLNIPLSTSVIMSRFTSAFTVLAVAAMTSPSVWAFPLAPAQSAFMQSIRDVAVFAWALVGINGSLADYSVGKPVGESQPPNGFPVWDTTNDGQKPSLPSAPSSGYVSGSGSSSGQSNDPWGFGDPGLT